ncbi:MAG TPA: hypothetical protein VNQ31_06375 [Sphingomonadaceae bacterium]|nr:hypothetical protein [Sphingomonadaceae bacterium]
MRILLTLLLVVVILLIGAFAFNLIDISQTREGRLPTVDIRGGQAPAYDVSTGAVKVGSKTTSVAVPRLDTTRKTIEVPTVNVTEAR